MKLLEYESKKILSDQGIPIPNGQVIETPEEINNLPAKLHFPMAVKAQVFTTGRGKAGGIRFAECESELTEIAHLMQGDQIRGFPIQSLLLEKKLPINKELYLGITLDNSRKKRVMLACSLGGMDLNQVAKRDPEQIHKRYLHSLIGAPPYLTRELAYQLKLPLKLTREVARILKKLYQISLDFDATLAEINPLVVTEDGRLYAADAHIEIEDEAAFRQEKNLAPLAILIREQKGGKEPTEFEKKAAKIDRMSYRGVAGRVVEFEDDYGTEVVAGVTPGKGGQTVHGIPVYNSVREAVENHSINATVVSVPPAFAKDATMEAIDADIELINVFTERIPRSDVIEFLEFAELGGVRVIGPNSLGVISPGKGKLGPIGGPLDETNRTFTPGEVGIISRSGSMTTETANMLSVNGFGQSTAVSIGGDPIVGSTFLETLPLFEI